jgi:hypothetical protein
MQNSDKANDIEAYSLIPGAIVYRNAFKDIDNLLSFFKEAESYAEDTYIMKKFHDWGDMGIMTEIDSQSINANPLDKNNQEDVRQKEIFQNIYNSYKYISKDFISKYANKNIWPSSYKKVDLLTEAKNTKIAFLKYNYEKDSQDKRFLKTSSAFHSDYFEQDMDSPGYKLIFTVMLYLNDDYDGGEICFFDGTKIVGLKPKAGDAVVFPSCEPFYHGVLTTYKNDRYAIRMNYCIQTEGSDEFKSGSYTKSSNQTNYKVPFMWEEDGVVFLTSPGMKDLSTWVLPPKILNTDQMERVRINAQPK